MSSLATVSHKGSYMTPSKYSRLKWFLITLINRVLYIYAERYKNANLILVLVVCSTKVWILKWNHHFVCYLRNYEMRFRYRMILFVSNTHKIQLASYLCCEGRHVVFCDLRVSAADTYSWSCYSGSYYNRNVREVFSRNLIICFKSLVKSTFFITLPSKCHCICTI